MNSFLYVKKPLFGSHKVHINNGKKNSKIDPLTHALNMEKLGAGEIFINSVDQDGVMNGYDLQLIKEISEAVKIPVVASGGAGNFKHFLEASIFDYIHGLSASSVFHFIKINILDLKKDLKNSKVNIVE